LSRVVNGGQKLTPKQLKEVEPIVTRYGYVPTRGAKIISVVNNKGGVGKTTTSINLGAALNHLGYRVLIIDMDPQGNASLNFGYRDPLNQMVDVLLTSRNLPIRDVILPIGKDIDIAPTNSKLGQATLEMQNNPMVGYERMSEVLAEIKHEYDYIFIDCPPSLEMLTGTSLVASTGVIIVSEPEPYSSTGLENVFILLKAVRKMNPNLGVEGILFSHVKKNTSLHKDYMDRIRQQLKGTYRVFESVIRDNISLPEAVEGQSTIFDYDLNSNGAKDYLSLAKEISPEQIKKKGKELIDG
ncbi:ParA family protein, partial [Xanthovirga aplysinae]|uniref:ParA family protein n=1 Tax=Xanthovirga aplysinae TaxID=2529853 RepID=UPI0012BC972B